MSIEALGSAGATTSLHAMSGASGAGTSPLQKMSNLFDSIDSSGTGSITQAQFSQAFATRGPPAVFRNAGLTAIWNSIDPSGTGSVGRNTFVSAMTGLMASLRAEAPASSGESGASNVATSLDALRSIGSGWTSSEGSLVNLSV